MKKIIRGNLIKDKIRGNLIKDKIRGYVLFRKKLRRYSHERMGYLLDQNWKGYFEKKNCEIFLLPTASPRFQWA